MIAASLQAQMCRQESETYSFMGLSYGSIEETRAKERLEMENRQHKRERKREKERNRYRQKYEEKDKLMKQRMIDDEIAQRQAGRTEDDEETRKREAERIKDDEQTQKRAAEGRNVLKKYEDKYFGRKENMKASERPTNDRGKEAGERGEGEPSRSIGYCCFI